MGLNKHTSNDPRGDDPNPAEPDMVFKPRLFKTIEITRREFQRSFPVRYVLTMLAPMDVLEWNGIQPLPNDVYTNLVRFFYYNLKVKNLDNIEYTIDTRVQGKDIVLNLTILSEITEIATMGECIFISKPSQLDQYVNKK